MIMSKWENANLQAEAGQHLLPPLCDAVRYRGVVLYASYDIESGGCFGDEWEVVSERTGDVILIIRAGEDRAYAIATKLAEMLDWDAITEAGWATMTLDPVFLSFMAEHYQEVTIPIQDDDDLEGIVPFGPEEPSFFSATGELPFRPMKR